LAKDEGKYEQLLAKLIVQVRSSTSLLPPQRKKGVSLASFGEEPDRGVVLSSSTDVGVCLLPLLLQGLLLILSPEVTIFYRQKDAALAKNAAEAASKEYESLSGREVTVSLSEEYLSEDSAGGVKLVGAGNRISVNNTIDERLGLLEDKMLPEIRADLFGLNEVRT
jgi:V-type H+-transporting ATPase subunit E